MAADNRHTSTTGTKALPSEIREYIEKRIQLTTLKISEKISGVISSSVQKVAGILLIASGLWFAWFSLCFYLGDLLESTSLGFLAGAVPLLLIGILLYKTTIRSLSDKIQADIIAGMLQKVDPDAELEKDTGKSNIEKR